MTIESTAIILVAIGVAYVIARLCLRECPLYALRVGAYQLIEKVGAGGMGEVWRAKHGRLSRMVAIKIAHPEHVATDAQKQRFLAEAKATSRVRSPHTVELYDYGTTRDGRHYYAMELLDGENLHQLVVRDGPQDQDRVLRILTQAARALDEVHRAGLVHRDIKPSNIVLCQVGGEMDFVKVVDFGLVEPVRLNACAPESVSGSPAFLAPELVVGGDLDGRVDVYALGCVGFYLLTGEHVFTGSSSLEIISRHVSVKPDAPSDRLREPIDHDLEELILACLSKSPSLRPKSAGELLARLESIDLSGARTSPDRSGTFPTPRAMLRDTTIDLAMAC
jgi:serine/threonine-protein kinase